MLARSKYNAADRASKRVNSRSSNRRQKRKSTDRLIQGEKMEGLAQWQARTQEPARIDCAPLLSTPFQ